MDRLEIDVVVSLQPFLDEGTCLVRYVGSLASSDASTFLGHLIVNAQALFRDFLEVCALNYTLKSVLIGLFRVR